MKIAAILVALLTLISCSSNIPTAQPTSRNDSSSLTAMISVPTARPTETSIPEVTLSPTITPTPILDIPPYTTKQVLLEYTRSRAALGGPDEFFDIFFGNAAPRETIKLVLYSDGQVIIRKTPEAIVTKRLTESEMDNLLFELYQMGFRMTDTNQKHDDTDLLYDFGGRYQEVGVTDGAFSCLSLRSNRICYYEPYEDFVAPHMKRIFHFVEDYAPNNLTLYNPDRILLFVRQGQSLYNAFSEQSTKSFLWPSDLPPLETSEEKYFYLDREQAQEFFSLTGGSTKPFMVNENGKEYSVLSAVIFPHENISQP